MDLKFILIVIFSLPLIINPGLFMSTEPIYFYPKLWWIYLVILPAVLSFIYANRAKKIPRLSGKLLCSLAFCLAASGFSHFPSTDSWLGGSNRGDGIIMHFVYILIAICGIKSGKYFLNEKNISDNLTIIANFSLILSTICILQYFRIVPVLGEELSGLSATIGGGTLGNRGYMGGLLSILMVFVIWKQFMSPTAWNSFLTFITLSGLLMSSTRGAWIAGLTSLIILVIKRKLTGSLIISIITAIIFFSLTIQFLPRSDIATNGIQNDSGRSVLYKSAIIGIKMGPILGLGPLGLWQVIDKRPKDDILSESGLQEIIYSRKIEGNLSQAPSYVVFFKNGDKTIHSIPANKVHNEYLDYALTYGIPASMMFILIFTTSLFKSWKFNPFIAASVAAYGTYLATWPDTVGFSPIAWFVLGLALSLDHNPARLTPLRTKA